MTRAQIIKHFGNITLACEATGYSRFAIYKWRNGVPYRTQLTIEQITGGALKAVKYICKTR